jgi:3alpha(or 20beta)-hydroxysteroid dehydrogenase
MSNTLTNQVVLVTGAARGMSAEHVRGLVESGAEVVATDVRDDEGQALARKLGSLVVYARLDITDERAWRAAVALAWGAVGVLGTRANAPAERTDAR